LPTVIEATICEGDWLPGRGGKPGAEATFLRLMLNADQLSGIFVLHVEGLTGI
jgi:hypothetical protein